MPAPTTKKKGGISALKAMMEEKKRLEEEARRREEEERKRIEEEERKAEEEARKKEEERQRKKDKEKVINLIIQWRRIADMFTGQARAGQKRWHAPYKETKRRESSSRKKKAGPSSVWCSD